MTARSKRQGGTAWQVRAWAALFALLLAGSGFGLALAGPARAQYPAPPPSRTERPPERRAVPVRPQIESNAQPHLNTWLARHQNLSPYEQERALRLEPGFSRLPAPTQQRLVDRLRQIDSMPPAQRQRTLDRIEAMERLDPERRQEVRSSVQQFHALRPDRERIVRQAFHELREYPPGLRQSVLASGQYNFLTGQERGILSNILSVEPYEPHPAPSGPPSTLPPSAIR